MDLFLLLILIYLAGDPSPELSGNLQPRVLIYGLGPWSPEPRQRCFSWGKMLLWSCSAQTKLLGGEERGGKEGPCPGDTIPDRRRTRHSGSPPQFPNYAVFARTLYTWWFPLVSADNVTLLDFPHIPPSRYF